MGSFSVLSYSNKDGVSWVIMGENAFELVHHPSSVLIPPQNDFEKP